MAEPYVVAKSAPSEEIKWSTEAFLPGEPWMAGGLCLQVDPDRFFPERGESTYDAKVVCEMCDVKAQCLEYALRKKERWGVWGEKSSQERSRILNRGEYPKWKRAAELEKQRNLHTPPPPIDEPPTRRRAPRDDIDERIQELNAEGVSDPRIAIDVKLSTASVHRRRVRMGLPDVPRQRRQS